MQENFMRFGYLLRCFLELALISARDWKGNVFELDSVPAKNGNVPNETHILNVCQDI